MLDWCLKSQHLLTQRRACCPGLPRGPAAEEQSRTRSSQRGGVEDQPQCREMWHSSSPSARSLSRSPSPPPPSFTQSPSSPRSLVRYGRDGQTSPHKPRLVVSRSTCPPLSPSPHAKTFTIGTLVINTHTEEATGSTILFYCLKMDLSPSRNDSKASSSATVPNPHN
jgi:hypothetical protein